MKRVKLLTLAGAVLVVALAAVGCGITQPAATPAPATAAAPAPAATQPAATQTSAPAPAKATYVGEATCQGCHNKTKFDSTHHTESFTPLSKYQFAQALGTVTIYDGANSDQKSTQVDLSKALGIHMGSQIIVQVPKDAGFKAEFYRVATITKGSDGKYTFKPVATVEGKTDWSAEDYTNCAKCHAAGLGQSPTPGPTCEACHGPGSLHVAATAEKDKIATMTPLPSQNTCLTCHASDPTKDATSGAIITDNHHGTRDFTVSPHSENGVTCLACHNAHGANASGQLLKADNPNDICAKCHGAGKVDYKAVMYDNASDPHGHTTADHSFGAIPVSAMKVDDKTKNMVISDQAAIDKLKKALPILK